MPESRPTPDRARTIQVSWGLTPRSWIGIVLEESRDPALDYATPHSSRGIVHYLLYIGQSVRLASLRNKLKVSDPLDFAQTSVYISIRSLSNVVIYRFI